MDLTVKKSSQPSSTITQHEDQTTSVSKEVSYVSENDLYHQLLPRYLLLNPSMIGRNMAMSLPYFLSHHHSPLNMLSNLPTESLATCSDVIEKSPATESSSITSNLDLNFAGGERKRISRPLTGRYVRHGTGASPSTLITLRSMLQEKIQRRQSLKSGGQTRIKGRSRRRR